MFNSLGEFSGYHAIDLSPGQGDPSHGNYFKSPEVFFYSIIKVMDRIAMFTDISDRIYICNTFEM